MSNAKFILQLPARRVNETDYTLIRKVIFARGVDLKQNEEQYRKAPKRRTSIAEEWQRYADDRTQPYHHADINAEVEDEI